MTPMSTWLDVVDTVARRAWDAHVDWMLVGDAAAAFQGVALEPGEVDVLVRTPSAVATLAGHLFDLAVTDPTPHHPAAFLSSHDEPLLAYDDRGVAWTLGRWLVDGVRLEVAHLEASEPVTGLVETRGTRVWEVRRDVTAHGLTVPVAPLEVLVASAFAADNPRRRQDVAAALKNRWVDNGLFAEALRGRGFTPASVARHPELLELLPAGLRPPGHRTTREPAPTASDPA